MTDTQEEKISTMQATAKKLKIHAMVASLIVIAGVLIVFFSEDAEKDLGLYIIVFGISYSFITRIRSWRNR